MIADAVVDHADLAREVGGAAVAVGIEKEQRFVNACQPAAVQRPVHDIVMLLCRGHVIDVLRVVAAADRFPHAHELPGVALDHNIVRSSISRNKNGTFFVGQDKAGGKRWQYLELKKIEIIQQ